MSPDQPPELPTPPDLAAEQQFSEQRKKATEAAGDNERSEHDDGVLDQARALFQAALETVSASLALVRSEFHLARNSALFLVAMSCVLVVLAVGTWLGILALVASTFARLTHSWMAGIFGVVLLNSIAAVWVFTMIRRAFRDMGMPRTRRMLAGMRPQKTPQSSDESGHLP